jgi:hypothetical protein
VPPPPSGVPQSRKLEQDASHAEESAVNGEQPVISGGTLATADQEECCADKKAQPPNDIEDSCQWRELPIVRHRWQRRGHN